MAWILQPPEPCCVVLCVFGVGSVSAKKKSESTQPFLDPSAKFYVDRETQLQLHFPWNFWSNAICPKFWPRTKEANRNQHFAVILWTFFSNRLLLVFCRSKLPSISSNLLVCVKRKPGEAPRWGGWRPVAERVKNWSNKGRVHWHKMQDDSTNKNYDKQNFDKMPKLYQFFSSQFFFYRNICLSWFFFVLWTTPEAFV